MTSQDHRQLYLTIGNAFDKEFEVIPCIALQFMGIFNKQGDRFLTFSDQLLELPLAALALGRDIDLVARGQVEVKG